ncbi:MAG: methyltransferase, TIGR04325 family [Rhodospirillales bacterium]|nr:methyltransferase, TIGR04325 family [Rhodospirillales bacterium]
MNDLESIWSGVYSSFAESGGDQTVFDQAHWLESVTATAKQKSKEMSDSKTGIPSLAITQDYILPVVATLTQIYRKQLKILDFGGGLASSYLDVMACIQNSEDLEFHIVEVDSLINKAKTLLPDESQLFFHTSLPVLDDIGIVHIGSALQYIEDWKGLITKLAEYNADTFILAHLPAGDIPNSFVTLQSYYGHRIPCWFWNIADIVDHMDTVGYELSFKSRHLVKILGKVGALPMAALPEEYRLEDFCQLIFAKKTKP